MAREAKSQRQAHSESTLKLQHLTRNVKIGIRMRTDRLEIQPPTVYRASMDLCAECSPECAGLVAEV